MMGAVIHWTDAATSQLRSLFRDGASDADIARFLGTSLRAVIGRRQRLGLWRRIRYGEQGDDPLALALRRSAVAAARYAASGSSPLSNTGDAS